MMKKRKHLEGDSTQPVTSRSVSATEAQNNFGRVLGEAAGGRVVYITKYDRPAAVVMSIAEYDALTRSGSQDLDELAGEFEARLAGMQTSQAAAAVDSLFEMDPKSLGEAAHEAARNDKS
jgi:prevent-host-death family protein